MRPTYLIIGGDGLIGGRLYQALAGNGLAVFRTSRRGGSGGTTIFFDLENPSLDAHSNSSLRRLIKETQPTVFFAASVTGLKECASAPGATRALNVTNTALIVEELIHAGCFVVYLSSNAVFSGLRPYPTESEQPDPASEYGRQKAEVEAGFRDMAGGAVENGRIAIARLTKVLPDARGLVHGWIASLRGGSRIQALTDHILSPVSLPFVTQSLMKVASRRPGGIYHFSGDKDLSYHEFAVMLARAIGVSPGLVEGVEKGLDAGGEVMARPLHSALDMQQTTGKTGIRPQPLEIVVQDVLCFKSVAGGKAASGT